MTANELADEIEKGGKDGFYQDEMVFILRQQAQKIENLKTELALVKQQSASYETWWIKYRDMAVELDKELKELKKAREK
jgi:hypothetical protein